MPTPFLRDLARIEDAYQRVNLSPLGAAAFASTGFEIDRLRTCQLLGFDGLVENSMDAVSARDFILDGPGRYFHLHGQSEPSG